VAFRTITTGGDLPPNKTKEIQINPRKFPCISGANTPRKSDQGKTVAIIAQVDGKVL
jgi:hypothetical protein